jgi:hypothetical protein
LASSSTFGVGKLCMTTCPSFVFRKPSENNGSETQ